jgi:hypothetical protein
MQKDSIPKLLKILLMQKEIAQLRLATLLMRKEQARKPRDQPPMQRVGVQQFLEMYPTRKAVILVQREITRTLKGIVQPQPGNLLMRRDRQHRLLTRATTQKESILLQV